MKLARSLPSLVAPALALSLASSAFAQEPTPPAPPPQAAPAAQAAPAPALAPAAPSGCRLGAHEGVDVVDARTAANMVCRALAEKGMAGVPAEVRVEKLGSRVVLVVATDRGEEKHVLLSGIEEVPTAAPRLAESVAEHKPVAETETVKNVRSTEAPAPKTKAGQIGFNGGIIGVAPIGMAATPAPGVDLGLIYRGERWGVSASGRFASSPSDDDGVQYASLASGVRYSLGDGNLAPFAGAGISILALKVERSGHDFNRGGLGLYGEIGVDALRTHRVGFTASLRVDAPLFADRGLYAVPASFLVGMQFR